MEDAAETAALLFGKGSEIRIVDQG